MIFENNFIKSIDLLHLTCWFRIYQNRGRSSQMWYASFIDNNSAICRIFILITCH